jgi:hypothetical protein
MYGEEDDIHHRLKQRYGAHFTYNPALHYIHQTLERPMSLITEQKMVAAITRLHAKKGVAERTTYRNFVRYYRVRLFMNILKKYLGDSQVAPHIVILKEVIQYCRSVKST